MLRQGAKKLLANAIEEAGVENFLIPWLYLKGISTGDFTEALTALLDKDAPGLSPPPISRRKADWQEDLDE